jgi:GNAT superfamily N-acetyltransferase
MASTNREDAMPTPADTDQPPVHEVVIRPATPADAADCGRIFYDAFESIAARHRFPVEPASREFTAFKAGAMLATPGFAAFLAERDGTVLGAAFVDERAPIAGLGPVTIDPAAQDRGIGRALMETALARVGGRAGVRLVQTAYHYRSLALYASLGFVVREPLSVLQGPVPRMTTPGRAVRPAEERDVGRCGALCRQVHGHERTDELRDAIAAGTARVLERPSGISGYATGFGYGWHAVAEANEDLIALLVSAEAFIGLGILVPSRNAELLRWCLRHGLQLVQQSTLMTIGLYNEPAGAYLPSILF